MQLNNKIQLSFATILILGTSSILNASNSDFIRVNYMQYDENDNRISIKAPSIQVSKSFGTDYTLNASLVYDVVSGATPIYIDSSSGASAFSRGTVNNTSDIKKTNVKMEEKRTALNASLVTRLKNRDEVTTGFNISNERDYSVFGVNGDYLHWLNKSKNTSVNIGASFQTNEVIVQIPDTNSGASPKVSEEISSVFATEAGISQLIDKKSLIKGSIFYSYESGYLTNPYYNVVRNTNTVEVEKRPRLRVAFGFNIAYSNAISKKLTIHTKYKYYTDDWNIISDTFDINNYYEFNKKVIIGFGYRYYKQSSASFYNSSPAYFTNQKYASHDDRLSNFNSNTIKFSLQYKYNKKISYSMSYDIYEQSTGLKAIYNTIGMKYKF